jgi:hypothetical protein
MQTNSTSLPRGYTSSTIVISNWALKRAGKKLKVVFALLEVAAHQTTNTWGSGGLS